MDKIKGKKEGEIMCKIRISRRADIDVKADIFINDRIYQGSIQNVSENAKVRSPKEIPTNVSV